MLDLAHDCSKFYKVCVLPHSRDFSFRLSDKFNNASKVTRTTRSLAWPKTTHALNNNGNCLLIITHIYSGFAGREPCHGGRARCHKAAEGSRQTRRQAHAFSAFH